MFYVLYSSIMNNENTSITSLTGQGDTFPSRYSSPSAGKREGIMKHTKGKWVAHQIEETDEFAIFSLNTFIAQTENSMINEEPTKSEKQANANLIAAAPEMFKALKAMTKLFEERVPYPNNTQRYKQAIKAIAKAEGK